MVKIDISSENEGITVNCSELPEARVWLEVTNLSPFPIEIEGIEARLFWVSGVGRFISISRHSIKHAAHERVFLETDLTGKQAEHIKQTNRLDHPRLSVKFYMSCRLSCFVKQREIQTKNYRLLNCGGS